MKLIPLVLLLVALHVGAEESEWFYSNLSTPSARQFVMTPTHVGGHLRFDAKACPEDSPYLCYEAEGFQFAIPKEIGSQRKWALNGATYELQKESTLTLLGKPIVVAWIDQKAKKSSIRFLYSKAQGVIGFVSLNPKGPLFLLENSCGFGASKDCEDRTSKR